MAFKRALVGRPLSSAEIEDTLLSKFLALPIFAADAISSVAYATEAALTVLIAASLSARSAIGPISLAVAALLLVVTLSYRQTVIAYTTSGGSYVVARDNLGTLPGLVAAAALFTDYVLTVAVSVAAGVLALTSAAPSLGGARVALSLGFIALITLVNLRGVREAGLLFALPTYGFIVSVGAMIATGAVRCVSGCPTAPVAHPLVAGTGGLGVFLVLRAFASGSSALTGVEAIANGVSAFRHPQSRNAARTLAILGVIAIVLFLGVSYLAVGMHARPSASASVLSEIARASFPASGSLSGLYYVVQGFTLAILVLAANTSFQGFPRLGAMVAADRFLPNQFINLGDRLVYSNGIVILAVAASLLIWAFNANVDSLIHLYVVGVFTAFTLSQTGMVRYWQRTRSPGWQRRALINGVGASATGVVTAVVIATKFSEGAWAVLVAIPVMVACFYGVRHHYRKVARRLRATAVAMRSGRPVTNAVTLYVDRLDTATHLAVWYAGAVTGGDYDAVCVPAGRRHPDPRAMWPEFAGDGVPLTALSPAEGRVDAVLEHVWELEHGESNFVTVVIPEQFRRRLLLAQLAHRTELALKLRLLAEPGVAITDVPAHGTVEGWSPPTRLVCRVLVADAHAASLRAVNYARTLRLPDTRALSFPYDTPGEEQLRTEWETARPGLEVETVTAPYRDLGPSLLRYIRGLTQDPATIVSIVIPELVFSGWRALLHNQRALYIKRLLLFEPQVILSSVPYQLR